MTNMAVEIHTPQMRGQTDAHQTRRRAYRLVPPYRYDTGTETVVIEFVVLSACLMSYGEMGCAEVAAFPGWHCQTVLGRWKGRPRVEVTSLDPIAELRNSLSHLALLEQMGYPAVTDIYGRITIRTPRGEENHGRWGMGGPGSDDYMSFGVGE